MTSRNASRELRRAQARQNYLANRIAEDVAAGRQPDPRLVAEWELATMQTFARRNDLSRKPQPNTQP
jgi:hypothetical protein